MLVAEVCGCSGGGGNVGAGAGAGAGRGGEGGAKSGTCGDTAERSPSMGVLTALDAADFDGFEVVHQL